MRIERKEIEGVIMYNTIHDLDEITDGIDKKFYNITKDQVRDIIKRFYIEVCKDVIMNNITFIFPIKYEKNKNMHLYICDHLSVHSKYMIDDIKNGNYYYKFKPTLVSGDTLKRRVNFLGKIQELFESEISKNHMY